MNEAIGIPLGYQGHKKKMEKAEIRLCLKCTKTSCRSGECEKIKELHRMAKMKLCKK